VPLIRASEIRPFVAWMEAEGVPQCGYLERAGLPGDPMATPDQVVAGLPLRALLAEVARCEAGPDFGWRVGVRTDATALGAFVRVLPGARKLRDAIHSFCCELLWDSPTADFGLYETKAGGWFWRRPLPGVETARDVMEQYVAAMMVGIVRAIAGPSWSPALVKLQMRRIDPIGREVLGDPEVELGARITAVHLAPAVLTLPVKAPASPCDGGFSRRSGPEPAMDLVGALRQALPAALPAAPGIDWGAEITGTSRRTLQRRLAEHGLSWAGLMDEVRQEVACREIGDAALSIRDVARRVGYRDPANFTRAFRRWMGSSPAAYRENHTRNHGSRLSRDAPSSAA
jgi:AraC-like DNA-binding protein